MIQIDVEEIKGNVEIVTENVVLTATSPLLSLLLLFFFFLCKTVENTRKKEIRRTARNITV